MMLDYFKFFSKNSTADHTASDDVAQQAPVVVLIYGANQSSKSFQYIKLKLPNWQFVDVNYSSHNHFQQNLKDMTDALSDVGPMFIVAHSLGGVYAVYLTQYVDVVGGVTLSAPYGGSGVADWARYFVPGFALLKDIGRRSKPITDLQNIKITVPWLQVIGTTGNVPWINEENDGVLTIKSMKALSNIEYTEVHTNHYEIMCDDSVVDIIKDRYYNTY
jgi:pimeloyl-ACP methyl ester carboxylesterase